MHAFFRLLYARDFVPIERSSPEYQHLLYYPPSLLNELEALLKKAEAKAKTERAKNWVQLTREHFDYLKRISGMLFAHQNFEFEASPENRAAVLKRVDEFEILPAHRGDSTRLLRSAGFPVTTNLRTSLPRMATMPFFIKRGPSGATR